MTDVYVVTEGDYSAYHIEGIFSKKEDAEKLASLLVGVVETWTLDSAKDVDRRKVFCVSIDLKSGSVVGEWNEFWVTAEVHEASWLGEDAMGKSTTDQEHAMKLAVEARQRWLREQA